MNLLVAVNSVLLVSVCTLVDKHKVTASEQSSKRWPVIGVLAQSPEPHLKRYGDSYILAAYVKFIEQAGALVIPIRIDEPAEYYADLFHKLNGIVFPGGGVTLIRSPFAKAAEYIFNLAIKANDQGHFFPILGICLGFEELTVRRTITNQMVKCSGSDYAAPLTFTNDARESRLLENIPDKLYNAMSTWNVTYNNHKYCMTPEVFQNQTNLTNFFRVISTNADKQGLEFISTMEAYKYPFYGTQWHPEKNIYLWSDANVNHSTLAVQVTQYIADFFVNEARRSKHHCEVQDLDALLIFNYEPKYMGPPTFNNIYFFHEHMWCSNDMLIPLMLLLLNVLLVMWLTKLLYKQRPRPATVQLDNKELTQYKVKPLDQQELIIDHKVVA